MNDEQYNEYIQKHLKENEEKHFSSIKHNKNAVWERIEEGLGKKKVIPLWYYSAAAVIIIMLGFGFILYQQLNQKDQQIVYLKKQLERQQNVIVQLKSTDKQMIIKNDTVRIKQKDVVYIPVKSNEIIVKHDTIINVVKETDTVFLKEKSPQLFAKNEDKDEFQQAVKLTTATNQDLQKKDKKRRFIFLFGRPKNDVQPYESERLITLKTK